MIQRRSANKLHSVSLVAISLIFLFGCDKNIKSPDESETEYHQRKWNYYLLESDRVVDRVMIGGYGNVAVKRVITLHEDRWVTLDKALEYPLSVGFCNTKSRNEKPIRCNLAMATPQQFGCKSRGFSQNQCINLTVADGILEDQGIINRLKFVSLQPCLTFPRKNQFPRPKFSYGNIYSDLSPLNAVFICSRNRGRGVWTFRVALQAESGNNVKIVPDDFGGNAISK